MFENEEKRRKLGFHLENSSACEGGNWIFIGCYFILQAGGEISVKGFEYFNSQRW